MEVYGGAQTTERKEGVLTVKTYWPLGVGLEIDVTDAPTTLNWVHADRLGSPVGISDQSGVVKEKLAYDAWGRRRSNDGTILTPDKLDGVVDNRGFTGHEMLEQLELVHMNGRLYDPSIGRFISGDPLVVDSINGQNYNRYSYVLNNPTNLTDPTGFAQVTTGDCKVTNTCPGDQKPKCEKDCEIDAAGNPVRYRKISDNVWELDTGKVTSTTKSPNMQARTDAKNSANSEKPLQAAGCGQCNRNGAAGLANLIERIGNLFTLQGFRSNAEIAEWNAGMAAATAQGDAAQNAYLNKHGMGGTGWISAAATLNPAATGNKASAMIAEAALAREAATAEMNTILNFSRKAALHMEDASRAVPVDALVSTIAKDRVPGSGV